MKTMSEWLRNGLASLCLGLAAGMAEAALESGFSTNVSANGTFTIFAGDREPYSTYFVNKTANPVFIATHNVQLTPPPGTVLIIR